MKFELELDHAQIDTKVYVVPSKVIATFFSPKLLATVLICENNTGIPVKQNREEIEKQLAEIEKNPTNINSKGE